MSENERQDPADQYRTDEAVETEPQPDETPEPVEVTTETTVTETKVDPNKGYGDKAAGGPSNS